MSPRFGQVTIVGLGLMGGSLGLSLKRRRLASRVMGVSRSASTVRHAKRMGAIDDGTVSLEDGVRDAQLVVLATPVDTIVPLAQRAARAMPSSSIITDVGSTKHVIVEALERTGSSRVAFVGTHPLTGSEQRGLGASRADLYDDATCIVTKTSRSNRRAVETVTRFWRVLARRVLVMDPRRHDRLLAEVSHVPHMLAFALIEAASAEALATAPRSFLDLTRVAKSDADLWDDILISNRHAVLAGIRRVEAESKRIQRLLRRQDAHGLRQIFSHAQTIRQRIE